jgi:hypothetical protein
MKFFRFITKDYKNTNNKYITKYLLHDILYPKLFDTTNIIFMYQIIFFSSKITRIC